MPLLNSPHHRRRRLQQNSVILDADVINHDDKARHAMASIDRVKESLGLTEYPSTLLADGAMATT
ncbi:MAG: hypothetical protein ACKO2P_09980, partial [Planctomycetota bacterium]